MHNVVFRGKSVMHCWFYISGIIYEKSKKRTTVKIISCEFAVTNRDYTGKTHKPESPCIKMEKDDSSLKSSSWYNKDLN